MVTYFHPLGVGLIAEIGLPRFDDENTVFPAHELVIRPLLENSLCAYVYQQRKSKEDPEDFEPFDLKKETFLIPEQGKFRFDTTQECIRGREYLWNAGGHKRGSIIMILEPGRVDFSQLSKNTYRPGFDATPNMGNTLSAVKRCKEERAKGHIAICFPASNGIDWMDIYAQGDAWKNILQCVEANCHEPYYYGRYEDPNDDS